jgi:GH24 family phage-related lysozyme (muramidase)
MHASVVEVFPAFSRPLEGYVRSMYVDVFGLVTTGCGNLIDPIGLALQLPWRNRNGALASDIEVAADWERIKANADELKKRHYKYAEPLTNVRLLDRDIDALVSRRLRENAAILAGSFDGFERMPADAQLALSSMAWACGAGFPAKFPKFSAAVRAGDWVTAEEQCTIRTANNPGVAPRNTANKLCFRNTATVVAHGMDRSVLHWPDAAVAPTLPAPEPFEPVLEITDELRAELVDDRDDIIRGED